MLWFFGFSNKIEFLAIFVKEKISRFHEFTMHAYVILPMLSFAIVGAAQKLFYSNRFQCWIDRKDGLEDVGAFKAYGKGEWVLIAMTIWMPLNAFITFFVCACHRSKNSRKITENEES